MRLSAMVSSRLTSTLTCNGPTSWASGEFCGPYPICSLLTVSSDYVTKNIDYLKTQVGNPEGANKPNKKKYDPRVWVREGEVTMKARIVEALQDFNAAGSL